MTRGGLVAAAVFGMCLGAGPASAQPLGTFSWQLQPFCNVLTLSVVQQGPVYLLDGYDDSCGDGIRAPVVRAWRRPSPNGNIDFGLTIVNGERRAPVHVSAAIDTAEASAAAWNDSAGYFGHVRVQRGHRRQRGQAVATRSAQQLMVAEPARPRSSPTAGPAARSRRRQPSRLATSSAAFDAQGFDGTGYAGSPGGHRLHQPTETWTPTAARRRRCASTRPRPGRTTAFEPPGHRRTTAASASAPATPLDRLDVRGDIRRRHRDQRLPA